MKTIFKVGDVVHCCLFGEGKITQIYESSTFPILVTFAESAQTYTIDGAIFENAKPTLSLTPYKLEGFSQERKVDWNEFIGEWGFFWDDENTKLFGVLDEVNLGFSYPFLGNGMSSYECFQPLTPEMKQLLIEQGVINPSNSTPLDK